MLSMAKILLPVAFSERCRGAGRYAGALACHFHSELTLLYVLEPAKVGLGSVEAVPVALERLSPARIEKELDAFFAGELAGVPVKRVVLEGDPAREIVEYAHAERIDLIVMPTHGYGPFRRFLLGSVTAKVLHDADCPVWTGPHMDEAPAGTSISFRKILCALDLGPRSRVVLEWAAALAEALGSDVAIVHAIPTAETRLGGFYFDPEWRSELVKVARERILYLQKTLRIGGDVRIETGPTPAVVRDCVKEFHADLLVIGRAHSAGVLGRLRENAYAILRESPCPVASI